MNRTGHPHEIVPRPAYDFDAASDVLPNHQPFATLSPNLGALPSFRPGVTGFAGVPCHG
jgi:hypothetical protein